MSASPYDALFLAIGHLRAAKTLIREARYDHRPLPSSIDDLLRLEPREILKVEQRLLARARAIREHDAGTADQVKPSKPRRSAPRRAA